MQGKTLFGFISTHSSRNTATDQIKDSELARCSFNPSISKPTKQSRFTSECCRRMIVSLFCTRKIQIRLTVSKSSHKAVCTLAYINNKTHAMYPAQSPRIFRLRALVTLSQLPITAFTSSFQIAPNSQNGSTGLGSGSGPINIRLFSLISAVFLVYFSISSKSIAFSTIT